MGSLQILAIIKRAMNIVNHVFLLHSGESSAYMPRSGIACPANFSTIIDGKTKVFHDKKKFTHYISTNPAIQKIMDGKHQQKEGNYTLEKARN